MPKITEFLKKVRYPNKIQIRNMNVFGLNILNVFTSIQIKRPWNMRLGENLLVLL